MVARLLIGIVGLAICSALFAAEPIEPPPEAYLDPIDRQVAATGKPAGNRTAPCTILLKREMEGTTVVDHVEWMPTDKCVRMSSPKRFRGLWRADFEGSQFCEEPAPTCEFTRDGATAWLSGKTEDHEDGELYRVEFVGRKTIDAGTYGHFGMYAHEIIVDRMLSRKRLKRPKR